MKRLFAIGLAAIALACAGTPEVPEPPEVSAAPPAAEPTPMMLPSTASDLPRLGLAGVGSLVAALAIRSARRRFF